jgi:riboflavin kinase / FMN adenylyltransferase
MRVWTGPPQHWPESEGSSAVTIGVLDGVHLGHRSLIERLDPSHLGTVLTFDPHPIEVLRPGTHPRLITTIEERLDLLQGIGIDQAGVLDLDDIRELDPRRFVEEVLVGKVRVAHLITGPDFRFGKDRAGDTDLLAALAPEHGYRYQEIPLMGDGGGVFSSSRIRGLIEEGRPAEAAVALGSRFRVSGEVIRGDRRGSRLGFPTANLAPPERKVVPAAGVYAGYAGVGEARHHAAINVGVRPTFGGGPFLIEAHLLDFDADIYGEEISVELAHFLRPEARFEVVEELVAQMEVDVDQTRALLGDPTSNVS